MTWQEYGKWLDALGAKVVDYYADRLDLILLAISRGGLPVATYLSHKLDGVGIEVIDVSAYLGRARMKSVRFNWCSLFADADRSRWLASDPADRQLLIVDDICDTGETLRFVRKWVNNYAASDQRSACLIEKEGAAQPVDFVGCKMKSKAWVHFPYEVSEKSPTRAVGGG